MTYAPKTPVRVASFPLHGGKDWSERGVVLKPNARQRLAAPAPEWSLIRFETGGRLWVHASRLMADNGARR